MKPILLIQHDIDSPPGLVKVWLEENEKNFYHYKVFENLRLPEEDFSALILLGGEMNVDQSKDHPWIDDELALIQKFNSQGKKILGICLGAQLCAKALGAWVGPHPQGWEVGWHPVEILGSSVVFFHFHRYVFELPEGAELIAQNSWWKNQGFRWKENILALQFHPETDLAKSDAVVDDPALPEPSIQVQEPLEIQTKGRIYQKHSQGWFMSQLDHFFSNLTSA